MHENEKAAQKVEKRKCANCFACLRDTEMCPLNENYDPDAYLKIAEKLAARKNKRK